MTTPDAHFTVLTDARAPNAKVVASGDIDLYTAAGFAQALTAVLLDRPTTLTVDMSDVTFIDSMGLRTLVAAFKDGRMIGTAVHLSTRSGPVTRLLDATGLQKLFAEPVG